MDEWIETMSNRAHVMSKNSAQFSVECRFSTQIFIVTSQRDTSISSESLLTTRHWQLPNKIVEFSFLQILVPKIASCFG